MHTASQISGGVRTSTVVPAQSSPSLCHSHGGRHRVRRDLRPAGSRRSRGHGAATSCGGRATRYTSSGGGSHPSAGGRAAQGASVAGRAAQVPRDPRVRRLGGRHGQQQPPPDVHPLQLPALRQGLPRPQAHRPVLQRQDQRRPPSVGAGREGAAAAVPEEGALHRGAQDGGELRVRGQRLRQRHVPDHVGADDGAAAAAVPGVQGEGRGQRARQGALLHRDGQQRHRGALHLRGRHHGARVRGEHGEPGHRLRAVAGGPGREADRAGGGAAGGVPAVAAHDRRRAPEAVRHGPQPARPALQPQGGAGDGEAGRQAPRGHAGERRHLHHPRRRDLPAGGVRAEQHPRRVLRLHRAGRRRALQLRQPALQGPLQVLVLGQLPPHREGLPDPHRRHRRQILQIHALAIASFFSLALSLSLSLYSSIIH
ncbi:hypothetical protein VPH35_103495 [Triticum aestivum]